MSDEPMTSPEEGVAAQESTGESTERPPEMRTEDVLRFSINLFADMAWIQLGIRTNPATGDTQADLPQAKLAIDALGALIPLGEGRFEAHEMRDLRNLIAGLQLNFVQRQSAGS